ncbi:MAG: hypothetical protein IMW91_09445, partial [Firmicutes bacterium]|nr:hypothetical protein [Bacillota bacterium]
MISAFGSYWRSGRVKEGAYDWQGGIIGCELSLLEGGAAGASAAARARRRNEESEILLLEAGRYVSFANCGLPYYVGGEIRDREALLVTSEERF